MKLLFYSILCGLGVEAALVGTFLLFPIGSCCAPLPGVVVFLLHYPAIFLAKHVMRLTSDRQYLVVAPMLMAVVWIAVFALLGRLFWASGGSRDGHGHDI